jgi:hypothetical protein
MWALAVPGPCSWCEQFVLTHPCRTKHGIVLVTTAVCRCRLPYSSWVKSCGRISSRRPLGNRNRSGAP